MPSENPSLRRTPKGSVHKARHQSLSGITVHEQTLFILMNSHMEGIRIRRVVADGGAKHTTFVDLRVDTDLVKAVPDEKTAHLIVG